MARSVFAIILGLTLIGCGSGGDGNNGETTTPIDSGNPSSPASPSGASTGVIRVLATGLGPGETLTAVLNGSESIEISIERDGLFSSEVTVGSNYTVTFDNLPAGFECASDNASGTISRDTIVKVTCNEMTSRMRLVRDVNTTPRLNSSTPEQFKRYGDSAIFRARVTTNADLRFFITDGTLTGTRPWHHELTPPEITAQRAGSTVGEVNGQFLLVAGGALFATTDATATRLFDDWRSYVTEFVVNGDRALFRGTNNADNTGGIWRTDGTREGTQQLLQGAPSTFDEKIITFGTDWVFRDSIDGNERLWRTDGTEANTVAITPVETPVYGLLGELQEQIYFLGPSLNGTGTAVWRTDGILGSESHFSDLMPDDIIRVQEWVATETDGYFLAGRDVLGNITRDLWRTNGNTLFSIQSFHRGVFLSRITRVEDTIYFVAGGNLRQVLWQSDGDTASQVDDDLLYVNDRPGEPALYVWDNNLLYPKHTQAEGIELWITNGTTSRMLKDIEPGEASSLGLRNPEGIVLDDVFVFAANTLEFGDELWSSDGTTAGTQLVRNIAPEQFTDDGATNIWGYNNNGVYFTGCQDEHRCKLWVTDGSRGNTRIAIEIAPETRPSSITPTVAFALDSAFIFSTEEATYSVTATEGEMILASPMSGGTRLDNQAIFGVGSSHGDLWRTDGTPEGTVLISAVSSEGPLTDFHDIGGHIYFKARISNELRLVQTDGTDSGTSTITTAALPFGSLETAPLGDSVVLPMTDTERGQELWITDGTNAGTRLIADLLPGSFGSFPRDLHAYRNEVFFRATDDEGWAVWATDGQNVRRITGYIRNRGTQSGPIASQNGVLYFDYRDTSASRVTLHRSDGTLGGTSQLELAGYTCDAVKFASYGDALFVPCFSDDLQGFGAPIFSIQPDNIQLLDDAVRSAPPHDYLSVQSGQYRGLYFTGRSTTTGTELWKIDP